MVKNKVKSIISIMLILAMLVAMALPVYAAAIPGKTGIGMAEWAFRAYNEGWIYKYGGSSAGAVDCSGLIRSYCNGKGGGAKALLNASSVNGSTKDMPRIHGLGLWCEGHAGVYVGKNKDGVDMAIDMRNSKVNVVYSAMSSRYYSPWIKWFKISMISYPTNGWFNFNGEKFYYKNGEFCVGVVKVDGKTYDFGKSGALRGEVDPNKLTTTTAKKTTVSTAEKTTTTKKTTTSTTIKTTSTQKTDASITTTTTTTKKTSSKTTISSQTASSSTSSETKKTTSTKLTSAKKTTASKSAKKSTTKSTKKTSVKTSSSTQKTDKTTKSSVNKTSDTVATTQTATTTKKVTTTRTYTDYEAGIRNEDVKNLQKRLYDLGYYDQNITDYYGPFTRDAVKMFQIAIGAEPTGNADVVTQKALYSENAPKYSDEYSLMYDESYFIEGDSSEKTVSDSDASISKIPVIADSVGIASLSMTADPYDFTKSYGESGALQTMGVFSYKSPSVIYYHGGESYKISEEMSKSLENCVFL